MRPETLLSLEYMLKLLLPMVKDRADLFFASSTCCPQFCLSGSWDGTLRLWDLNTGTTTRRFVGHTKDVLSVAFSVDNRQARQQLNPSGSAIARYVRERLGVEPRWLSWL